MPLCRNCKEEANTHTAAPDSLNYVQRVYEQFGDWFSTEENSEPTEPCSRCGNCERKT